MSYLELHQTTTRKVEEQLTHTDKPIQKEKKRNWLTKSFFPAMRVIIMGGALYYLGGTSPLVAQESKTPPPPSPDVPGLPVNQKGSAGIFPPDELDASNPIDKHVDENGRPFEYQFYNKGWVNGKILMLADAGRIKEIDDQGWYLIDPNTSELEKVPVPNIAAQVWFTSRGWVYKIDSKREGRNFGGRPYEIWLVDENGNHVLLVENARVSEVYIKNNKLFYDSDGKIFVKDLDTLEVTELYLPVRENDPFTAFREIYFVSEDGKFVVVNAERSSEKRSICVIDTQASKEACVQELSNGYSVEDALVKDDKLYLTWTENAGDKVIAIPNISEVKPGDQVFKEEITSSTNSITNIDRMFSIKSLSFADPRQDLLVTEYRGRSLIDGTRVEGQDVSINSSAQFAFTWVELPNDDDPSGKYNVAMMDRGQVRCLTCKISRSDLREWSKRKS